MKFRSKSLTVLLPAVAIGLTLIYAKVLPSTAQKAPKTEKEMSKTLTETYCLWRSFPREKVGPRNE